MRYLLDTHTLLWVAEDNPHLSQKAELIFIPLSVSGKSPNSLIQHSINPFYRRDSRMPNTTIPTTKPSINVTTSVIPSTFVTD